MTVASLDLCEELYEVSRWLDTDLQWGKSAYSGEAVVTSFAERKQAKAHEFSDEPGAADYYDLEPAYDLGYLLRKLPLAAHGRFKLKTQTAKDTGNRVWLAHLDDHITEVTWIADTPEDATCGLLVELFKKNILQREAGDGS